VFKELRYDYFFRNMEACPIKKAFEGIEYVWEALKKKDRVMKVEDKKRMRIPGNVSISGRVVIGKDTLIDDYCVIKGPSIIGEGCRIRSGVLIRPGTIIGNSCVIGHGSEIKNSIVFDYAKISSNCFVGDSIIGEGARLGSGAITGNRRFDQKPVTIKFKEKRYDTGYEKFGCVLGDYSRLGANVVTNPGTLIGPYTWVYGCSSIGGFIKERTLVKLRQKFELVEKEKQVLAFRDREGKV